MALFEDEEFTEEEEEENEYLSRPEKGMELIRSLFVRPDRKAVNEIAEIIDKQIMPLLPDLDIETQRTAVLALRRVRDQITETRKVTLLHDKTVLGIGGKFSAGKSCFINSLTDAGLPEGQRATTSIATYIVQADQKRNYALTASDRSIVLNDQAVEALTHEFSRRYNIGFSRVIENLAICSPDFRYPHIALLDTPGYSKADAGKSVDASDVEIARRQLRAADYLIWLMDAEGGVISQSDLEFLRTLNIETKILFVFNKADLRTPEQIQEIVVNTEEILQNSDRPPYAVIAYDSPGRRTVAGGGDTLIRFMSDVDRAAGDKKRLPNQLDETKETVMHQILEKIDTLRSSATAFQDAIAKSKSPKRIQSLIYEYANQKETVGRLQKTKKQLKAAFSKLLWRMEQLEETH